MSAYSAQSYYSHTPASSGTGTYQQQPDQAYAMPAPQQSGTPDPAGQPPHPHQPPAQASQSPQPQAHQQYYYNGQAAASLPPGATPQQAQPGYYAASPAGAPSAGGMAGSPMYVNQYGTPGAAGAPGAQVTSAGMAYASATAYPHQYQYAQQAQQMQQPYQAAYLNSYPGLQPYQYLQQQQQQHQQAIYQQQYQQQAYHHQQAASMLPTITDPTGQKSPPNIKPKITTTLWEDEGTLCFQVEARGICVARREDNNMINGTKLLNVAGMTRGRRDGILKGEKNRHVVKAGAMHLKGVWIPYERALDFANREKIIDSLYPLFVTDLKALLYHPANFARTAQVLSAAEKRKAEFQKDSAKAEGSGDEKQSKPSTPNPKEEKSPAPESSQSALSGRFSVDRIVSTKSPTHQQPSTATPPVGAGAPNALGKPYYYGAPGGAVEHGQQPSSAYAYPPISASHLPPQDPYGQVRYPGAPPGQPAYAIPQSHNPYGMYQQQPPPPHFQQPHPGAAPLTQDNRVPLVSPVSSTGGPVPSTPSTDQPGAQPAPAAIPDQPTDKPASADDDDDKETTPTDDKK